MYRSAFEWSRLGYTIIRGERSHRRVFGTPMFHRNQVRDRRRAPVLVREVVYRYAY